jgi:hypothetical protein
LSHGGGLRGAITRWGTRAAKKRVLRELQEYRSPPEVKFGGLFTRWGGAPKQQVFRSLVQVNFYRERSPPA